MCVYPAHPTHWLDLTIGVTKSWDDQVFGAGPGTDLRVVQLVSDVCVGLRPCVPKVHPVFGPGQHHRSTVGWVAGTVYGDLALGVFGL